MVIKDKVAQLPPDTVLLKNHERIHLGIEKSDERPYMVLKYYDSEFQCFSAWSDAQLSNFSDFNRKLGQVTWQQIYNSGGKLGSKTGFGFTIHKDHCVLPNSTLRDLLKRIDPNINFFELRAGGGPRLHGFRVKTAFYLVWLDKDHEIYKRA